MNIYEKSIQLETLLKRRRQLRHEHYQATKKADHVYGNCKDGSYQMALHNWCTPIERQLLDITYEINKVRSEIDRIN